MGLVNQKSSFSHLYLTYRLRRLLKRLQQLFKLKYKNYLSFQLKPWHTLAHTFKATEKSVLLLI